MRQVERHIIIKNKSIESLCLKSARLYNFINYHKRQAFFGKQKDFKEYEISGLCAEFNQEDFRALPAQTSQQVIKQVFKAWKSYWAALKEWKKNPGKFLSRPNPPKYKDKTGHNKVEFTSQQAKLKGGLIYFPKQVNLTPISTKVDNFDCVRIIPTATCFVIEVVYEKTPIKNEKIRTENVLSIDLGINNLVTAIDNVGNRPFIINGGGLKAINAYYNRAKSRLLSYIGNKGTSNRIRKLTLDRNNKVEDALHQVSSFILKYCLKNNIGTVVIGKNPNWKQGINIGRVNNQNFVSVPHAELIDKIQYKLELNGIRLIAQDEAHTSKCDHLAFEPVERQQNYLGKRVKRGLFRSSIGKAINADVNGAIGILVKSKVVRECQDFIQNITDTGLAFNPYKVKFVKSFELNSVQENSVNI